MPLERSSLTEHGAGRRILCRTDLPEAGEAVAIHPPAPPGAAEPHWRQLLDEERHIHQQTLDALPIPVFVKDGALRYRACNRAFAALFERGAGEILGHSAEDLVPQTIAARYRDGDIQALHHGPLTYEGVIPARDGKSREVIFHKAPYALPDGRIGGIVGSIIDISGQRLAERELLHLHQYDPLTGLMNRATFCRQFQTPEALPPRGSLQIIDLDSYKVLHDILGNTFCRWLLVEVVSRLRGLAGSDGLLAHLGEDKFALLVSHPAHETEAIAGAILAELARPVLCDGQTMHITACIGIVQLGDGAYTAEDLLRGAELALRRAKRRGRGQFAAFSRELDQILLHDLALEGDLHHALRRNELSLVFQPQFRLGDRQLSGFEALLRWHHPRLGAVPPDRFIPLAERSSLIHDIGDWILAEGCRQNLLWREKGAPSIPIAINLSACQLQRGSFVERLQAIIQSSGIAPGDLELELTENIVMSNAAHHLDTFAALKGLGVRVAIDDFGTGYSSLAYLRHFPLDRIKIDRSFIREIPDNDRDCAILDAIIAMARRLDMDVVAEGVETRQQADYLIRCGCDHAQGYYFSPPLPAEQLHDCLASPFF